MKIPGRSVSSPAAFAQMLCLLMACALEFLVMIHGNMSQYRFMILLRIGMLASCTLFVIASFFRIRQYTCIRPLILPMAMVLWFLVIECIHGACSMDTHPAGLFLSVYCLAYPYAFVACDKDRQTGLKIVALSYIAAALLLSLDSFVLIADRVPAVLEGHLFWDGARLNIVQHPNVIARAFMIGTAFCLGLAACSTKKWATLLSLIAAGVMFAFLSLTNSRAAIVLTCLLGAGTVFFIVLKGSWKRLPASVLSALIVLVSLYLISQALFLWNSNRLMSLSDLSQTSAMQRISEEEPAAPAYQVILLSGSNAPTPETPAPEKEAPDQLASDLNPQGTLISDLPTLNSRTLIWRSAFQTIENNPTILLWGTDNTELYLGVASVEHTHNSWLETLLRLGLPGLIFSLLFTLQAAWSILCLLWNTGTCLWKKIIAMLVLCLMVSSLLEPSLFFTLEHWHFVDFLFFLCLGYLVQWKDQLRRQGS